MAARLDVISFLSDYGRTDEFVGVCHGVMVDLAPHVRVLDITHDVPAFDVRAGALTLVRAVQYLPEGVVLAVVDPGVGTERRVIAVEVEHGYFVGPDNGLLAPAVALLGGPGRIVECTNPELRLSAPGPTFAGRDVMAPAAAHLANGHELTDLGPAVEPSTLAPGLLPLPEMSEDGTLACEVLWVDHFGNCQLNVGPEQLEALGVSPGDAIETRIGDRGRRTRWVQTFAAAKPSELVLIIDSYGAAALALDRASAAAECKLRAGSKCTLVPPGARGSQ